LSKNKIFNYFVIFHILLFIKKLFIKMDKIKISDFKRIIEEQIEINTIDDNESLLKLVSSNLENITDDIEKTLSDNTYSLEFCYDKYKSIKNLIGMIKEKIFNPKELLSNADEKKLFFLVDLKSQIEKLDVVIDLLISKVANKIKNKNKSFKKNVYNEKKMEVEDNLDKLFKELSKKDITPVIKKLGDVIKEMRNYLNKMTTKFL